MDYRVPDPGKVWPVLQRSKAALASLGAHYVLVYTSTREQGRVMVTISLRS
ncbi:MAG TPA: fatty-acid--CoA ligase, partial [Mycobacterium sp.]|nr:fatty-acid--CoA ligase [Mycobacterium sp.]